MYAAILNTHGLMYFTDCIGYFTSRKLQLKMDGTLPKRLNKLRQRIANKRGHRLQIYCLNVYPGEFDADTIIFDPAFNASSYRHREWAQIQNLNDCLAILKRELALLTKDEKVIGYGDCKARPYEGPS